MKTKIIVTGLIENKNKQFLISQRNDPKIVDAHMKWDFPGGAINFGETPEAALKREVKEETGLAVVVGKMIPLVYSKIWLHEDYKIHVLVLCYQCKLIGGKINLSDYKINDLKWICRKDFDKYTFLPSIKVFLEASKI